MVLDSYRNLAERILTPLAKRLSWLSPNTTSWLALIFAILTGYMFYTGKPVFLLLASLFIMLSGFFDALDGVLARVSKKASKRGDFLDHVLDRYADIFIIAGLMLSPYVSNFLGFLAIIGVLMTSYVGTQTMALTGKRNYGGYLVRVDRLALLVVFPIIHYFLQLFGVVLPYGINTLTWLMIYFAVVGNLTAIQRSYKAWKQL